MVHPEEAVTSEYIERELAVAISAELLQKFQPRLDVFAEYSPLRETDTKATWHPVCLEDSYSALTIEAVAQHVSGKRTLGFYPLHKDGTCNSISIDFDDHRGARQVKGEPAEDAKRLAGALEAWDVPFLLNVSRRGHGLHLHVFLPQGTRAAEARAVMLGVIADVRVLSVEHGGSFDAVFPKQDVLAKGGVGNLLCLPLAGAWMHHEPPGTYISGVNPADLMAQFAALRTVERVSSGTWGKLVAHFAHLRERTKKPTRTTRVGRAQQPTLTGPVETTTPTHSAWEIALRRTGRLGRSLGEGKFALVCINDAQHSTPDETVEQARGSCVLLPPTEQEPHGRPHCSHAHCASLTVADWVEAIGLEVWDAAISEVHGWVIAGPYIEHNGGVSRWRRANGGTATLKPDLQGRLCNFTVRIVSEIHCHTPSGIKVSYKIRGRLDGQERGVEVDACEFAKMRWVAGLGAGAIISAGRERADQLREAIQWFSRPVLRQDRYEMTGWQQIDARWVYLHAGGAIDERGVVEGLSASMRGDLQRFELPPPPEGEALRTAVNCCADLFRLPLPEVMMPLFGAPWRAAIGGTRATVYVVGPPQMGKSLLVGLVQQHFGAMMDESKLPATFRQATAGSVNQLRGFVGDAVFGVDDFVPSGSADDTRLHAQIDTVVRAGYSGTGARRLRRDGSEVLAELPPRSMAVLTGETAPPGLSLRTRMVILDLREPLPFELAPHKALAREGIYASAMAAYVRWLAPHLEQVREETTRTEAEIADELRHATVDRRAAALLAELVVGTQWFAKFAATVEALSPAEADALVVDAKDVARRLLVAQTNYAREEDPVRRFCGLLASVLRSGRAHLEGVVAVEPPAPELWGWSAQPLFAFEQEDEEEAPPPSYKANGRRVGWTDGECAWIIRHEALALVRRLAEEGGHPIQRLGERELAQRLRRAGMLGQVEESRETLTVRKTIRGESYSGLLCLRVSALGVRRSADHSAPTTDADPDER